MPIHVCRTNASACVLAASLCLLLDQWPLTYVGRGWQHVVPRLTLHRKVNIIRRRAAEDDWREFRARLVQQERKSGEPGLPPNGEKRSGWAHPTPLIERGSVLLSSPGDHFALNQQYFHKAVILVIKHDDTGDLGLILNRPTLMTTDDLPLPLKVLSPSPDPELSALGGLRPSNPRQQWPVWCGGDCEGLNTPSSQLCFCLHISDALADISLEIIQGVYLIDFEEAQKIVESGKADRSDFMLLVGYCGWGGGQMQSELDRGDTWSMAAADQQALLGELREAQSLLLKKAGSFEAVGDGIEDWRRLYVSLGDDYYKRLAQARMTADDEHADKMLHQWIERCLVPASPDLTTAAAARVAKLNSLQTGAILRGSATAWLLGKPSEDPEFSSRQFRPAQYLHKGVLLLLNAFDDEEPSTLALLNGEVIGTMPDGTDLLFGGMNSLGAIEDTVTKVGHGKASAYVVGTVVLLPGVLRKLVALGALDVADGIEVEDVLGVQSAQRWQVAGGTEPEPGSLQAELALSGDLQQQKWYTRVLGLQKT